MAAHLPVLHVVTDDAVLSRPDFADRAREVISAGGHDLALHLRGPRTGGVRLYDLATALRDRAGTSGARLLVNDRVDVAACAGAHGVQLGQRSLDPGTARGLLPPGALVGVSVHGRDEARDARGADFLMVGTLFATPSHPGRAGAGPGLISEVKAVDPGLPVTGPPVIGIGGVTVERLGSLREAGAWGVAVLRGVWEVRSPAEAVAHYLTGWRDAV